ncbi:MAG: helix-hairpin-helix domain-containing protein, partial [Bacteriovoracaceae bacterium]
MKKAQHPDEVKNFEEIPNIGEAMADDLRSLGLKHPHDLKKQNPYELYLKLCRKTKSYQDPCVLDVFM